MSTDQERNLLKVNTRHMKAWMKISVMKKSVRKEARCQGCWIRQIIIQVIEDFIPHSHLQGWGEEFWMKMKHQFFLKTSTFTNFLKLSTTSSTFKIITQRRNPKESFTTLLFFKQSWHTSPSVALVNLHSSITWED